MTSVLRDARGWVTEAKYKTAKWKWLRDSSGRPTRIIDPNGNSLGIERDDAGIIRHIRYPDGSLLQLTNTPKRIGADFINEDGDKLYANGYHLDANGRLSHIKTLTDTIYLRRDLGEGRCCRDSIGTKMV